MLYSSGIADQLFWFVETRETAKLLKNNSSEVVDKMVYESNIYQQNQFKRMRREYNTIKKRLNALPEELFEELIRTDVNTAKIIVFISIMATNLLLFEFVYEVYQDKIRMGETEMTDKDFNVFFSNKIKQSKKVAGWSDSVIAKLKQIYAKYLYEAGLIEGTKYNKKICKVYIDQEFRDMIIRNNMGKFLFVLTGEN